ncbi:uncharacterized protein [Henckelia pumila]|uniref:uncharacterized protein n=1 Tax=Henckelia pumila TaxID=405737 RepID=UPI003C6E123C
MRDDDIPGPKPRAQWTPDENIASIYNVKSLNAMFTSVDMNMFNLIGTCTCARDAWEKLQTHCEGSASVKKTRMRLITSKFEKMRMEESETIMEYNGRLKSLANEACVLGDPISNERLVFKMLRSVSKRFHTKVCAIDESKDTSIMDLDELTSSLRTYEMELEAEDDSKSNSIEFQEVKESDLEENSIALISKKFTDYLKRSLKNQLILEDLAKGMKGYGHYAYECANRLRKGMNVSLSDDDSEEKQEKVEQEDLISFTALLDQEEQVADAYTLEGIQKLYEELYCDWIKRNQLNTTLTKENTELKADVARLEVLMSKKDLELGLLNSELERAKTTLDKFNSSSNKLDSLLTMSKNDKFGLDFKESVFETGESSKTSVFVKEGSDSLNHPSTASKGKKPIVEKNVSVPKPKQWKRPFVCHYCLKPGHIRPFCRKLKNDYILWESKQVLPPVLHSTKRNTDRKESTANKVWVQKYDVKSFVIYTSLKANTAENWYFDSGSSRHMTGLKDHLTDYIEQNEGRVTYGGGAKGRIVGKGTLNVEGFPKLHNVLHVEGLNANLISISTRSVNNCYQLGEELACRHSKFDEFSLWHQKLGHVNFKTIKNLSKFEAVRGLRNIKSDVSYVCGACQKGKQTRVSHHMLQHCGTIRCLELLHMDLMGPMEVESYGDLKGKTAEYDIEGLLEISHDEHSVVPDVAIPNTTLVPPKTVHEENSHNNEKTEVSTKKNIPSKIQKNHPSSQIIGDVHGTRQTRVKDKVDYHKMAGLLCMSFVYS